MEYGGWGNKTYFRDVQISLLQKLPNYEHIGCCPITCDVILKTKIKIL